MTPGERIAELEAENARLRSELAIYRQQEKGRKRSGYHARRHALIARGQWQPEVPVGPVRDHVRRVMAATGMSGRQFAVAAGLDEGTVTKILYEKGKQRVRAAVAAKARAVTGATPVPADGLVSAAGPARRLQALACLGWSVDVLAGRTGLSPDATWNVRAGKRQRVSAGTAARIAAVYDELWNTAAPESARAEKISASKARATAGKNGWAPPGAWNDDEIDNPQAAPAEGWQRRRRLTVAETAAEARDLMAGMGASLEEAASRLGVAVRTVERALAAFPDAEITEGAA